MSWTLKLGTLTNDLVAQSIDNAFVSVNSWTNTADYAIGDMAIARRNATEDPVVYVYYQALQSSGPANGGYINPVGGNDYWLNVNAGKFKFARVNGSDEVRQRVKVSLMHYQGEYFLNIPAGVPWYKATVAGQSAILGTTGSYSYTSNLLRSFILAVPGVIKIVDFQLTYKSRKYSVIADIVVQKGPYEISDLKTVDGIYIGVN